MVITLGVMKVWLVGATQDHTLLKKKSDALTMQFRHILKCIVAMKESMGKIMKASTFSLTEAKYTVGERIKHIVRKNVNSTMIRVRAKKDKVVSVKLPKFEYYSEAGNDGEGSTGRSNDLISLARGGQQVHLCRLAYIKSIEVLVELTSLQTLFLKLDEAIKAMNRRVNAIENVVKPILENTISYTKASLTSWRGRISSS